MGGYGARPWRHLAAARKPQPHHLRRERHALVIRRRARGGPERPEGAADAGLHEPHVLRLALLVRFAAADGDEDSVGGVGDVAPAEDAHLAPPHTRYEDEPRDHGVEADALEGHLVGLDAAALADAPVRPRESQVRTRRRLSDAGGGVVRGPGHRSPAAGRN